MPVTKIIQTTLLPTAVPAATVAQSSARKVPNQVNIAYIWQDPRHSPNQAQITFATQEETVLKPQGKIYEIGATEDHLSRINVFKRMNDACKEDQPRMGDILEFPDAQVEILEVNAEHQITAATITPKQAVTDKPAENSFQVKSKVSQFDMVKPNREGIKKTKQRLKAANFKVAQAKKMHDVSRKMQEDAAVDRKRLEHTCADHAEEGIEDTEHQSRHGLSGLWHRQKNVRAAEAKTIRDGDYMDNAGDSLVAGIQKLGSFIETDHSGKGIVLRSARELRQAAKKQFGISVAKEQKANVGALLRPALKKSIQHNRVDHLFYGGQRLDQQLTANVKEQGGLTEAEVTGVAAVAKSFFTYVAAKDIRSFDEVIKTPISVDHCKKLLSDQDFREIDASLASAESKNDAMRQLLVSKVKKQDNDFIIAQINDLDRQLMHSSWTLSELNEYRGYSKDRLLALYEDKLKQCFHTIQAIRSDSQANRSRRAILFARNILIKIAAYSKIDELASLDNKSLHQGNSGRIVKLFTTLYQLQTVINTEEEGNLSSKAALYNHLIEQMPLGVDLHEMLERSEQERLDQRQYAKNIAYFDLLGSEKVETVRGGVVSDRYVQARCERDASGAGIKITQQGWHNPVVNPDDIDGLEQLSEGELRTYTLTVEPIKSGYHLKHNIRYSVEVRNAAGQLLKDEGFIIDRALQEPGLPPELSHYFSKSILDKIDRDQGFCDFNHLYADLRAQACLIHQAKHYLYQDMAKAVEATLTAEQIDGIRGTGYDPNPFAVGENFHHKVRSAIVNILIERASQGRLALDGYCGLQQDVFKYFGAQVCAYMDFQGKDYRASPHGNDAFTVEEKQTFSELLKWTETAGFYEASEGTMADKLSDMKVTLTQAHQAVVDRLKFFEDQKSDIENKSQNLITEDEQQTLKKIDYALEEIHALKTQLESELARIEKLMNNQDGLIKVDTEFSATGHRTLATTEAGQLTVRFVPTATKNLWESREVAPLAIQIRDIDGHVKSHFILGPDQQPIVLPKGIQCVGYTKKGETSGCIYPVTEQALLGTELGTEIEHFVFERQIEQPLQHGVAVNVQQDQQGTTLIASKNVHDEQRKIVRDHQGEPVQLTHRFLFKPDKTDTCYKLPHKNPQIDSDGNLKYPVTQAPQVARLPRMEFVSGYRWQQTPIQLMPGVNMRKGDDPRNPPCATLAEWETVNADIVVKTRQKIQMLEKEIETLELDISGLTAAEGNPEIIVNDIRSNIPLRKKAQEAAKQRLELELKALTQKIRSGAIYERDRPDLTKPLEMGWTQRECFELADLFETVTIEQNCVHSQQGESHSFAGVVGRSVKPGKHAEHFESGDSIPVYSVAHGDDVITVPVGGRYGKEESVAEQIEFRGGVTSQSHEDMLRDEGGHDYDKYGLPIILTDENGNIKKDKKDVPIFARRKMTPNAHVITQKPVLSRHEGARQGNVAAFQRAKAVTARKALLEEMQQEGALLAVQKKLKKPQDIRTTLGVELKAKSTGELDDRLHQQRYALLVSQYSAENEIDSKEGKYTQTVEFKRRLETQRIQAEAKVRALNANGIKPRITADGIDGDVQVRMEHHSDDLRGLKNPALPSMIARQTAILEQAANLSASESASESPSDSTHSSDSAVFGRPSLSPTDSPRQGSVELVQPPVIDDANDFGFNLNSNQQVLLDLRIDLVNYLSDLDDNTRSFLKTLIHVTPISVSSQSPRDIVMAVLADIFESQAKGCDIHTRLDLISRNLNQFDEPIDVSRLEEKLGSTALGLFDQLNAYAKDQATIAKIEQAALLEIYQRKNNNDTPMMGIGTKAAVSGSALAESCAILATAAASTAEHVALAGVLGFYGLLLIAIAADGAKMSAAQLRRLERIEKDLEPSLKKLEQLLEASSTESETSTKKNKLKINQLLKKIEQQFKAQEADLTPSEKDVYNSLAEPLKNQLQGIARAKRDHQFNMGQAVGGFGLAGSLDVTSGTINAVLAGTNSVAAAATAAAAITSIAGFGVLTVLGLANVIYQSMLINELSKVDKAVFSEFEDNRGMDSNLRRWAKDWLNDKMTYHVNNRRVWGGLTVGMAGATVAFSLLLASVGPQAIVLVPAAIIVLAVTAAFAMGQWGAKFGVVADHGSQNIDRQFLVHPDLGTRYGRLNRQRIAISKMAGTLANKRQKIYQQASRAENLIYRWRWNVSQWFKPSTTSKHYRHLLKRNQREDSLTTRALLHEEMHQCVSHQISQLASHELGERRGDVLTAQTAALNAGGKNAALNLHYETVKADLAKAEQRLERLNELKQQLNHTMRLRKLEKLSSNDQKVWKLLRTEFVLAHGPIDIYTRKELQQRVVANPEAYEATYSVQKADAKGVMHNRRSGWFRRIFTRHPLRGHLVSAHLNQPTELSVNGKLSEVDLTKAKKAYAKERAHIAANIDKYFARYIADVLPQRCNTELGMIAQMTFDTFLDESNRRAEAKKSSHTVIQVQAAPNSVETNIDDEVFETPSRFAASGFGRLASGMPQ